MESTRLDYFPFHPEKFLSSIDIKTMGTTNVGAYCLLLFNSAIQPRQGYLPNHEPTLKKLTGCDGQAWEAFKPYLSKKFKEEDGFIYNQSFLDKINKVLETRKALSEAGLRGANKRWAAQKPGNIGGHMRPYIATKTKTKTKTNLTDNSNSLNNSETKRTHSNKEGSKGEEFVGVFSLLRKYLSGEQTAEIKNLLPGITEEYAKEKINLLLKSKNIRNQEAFLYSALIYNYEPGKKESKPELTQDDLAMKLYETLGYLEKDKYSKATKAIQEKFELQRCLNGEYHYFLKEEKGKK